MGVPCSARPLLHPLAFGFCFLFSAVVGTLHTAFLRQHRGFRKRRLSYPCFRAMVEELNSWGLEVKREIMAMNAHGPPAECLPGQMRGFGLAYTSQHPGSGGFPGGASGKESAAMQET